MSKKKELTFRSRTHFLLLYPDCPSHVSALEKIVKSYDYAYILHDRDIANSESGELKKPHWHVCLRFTNQQWNTAVCKQLGIDVNYDIDEVRNFDNCLQYLIHYNDTDKTQYPIDDVKGTLKQRLIESINKVDKSESEKVVELIAYIEEQSTLVSYTDFARYCAQQGYWSEYRRSASIFYHIINEHNFLITEKE